MEQREYPRKYFLLPLGLFKPKLSSGKGEGSCLEISSSLNTALMLKLRLSLDLRVQMISSQYRLYINSPIKSTGYSPKQQIPSRLAKADNEL